MMAPLKSFFSEQLVEAFGWAIFHSVWQAVLLLVMLIVIMAFMKNYSARIRYFVAYSFLLLVLCSSVMTGIKAYIYAIQKKEIREQLVSNPDRMASEIKTIVAQNDIEISNEAKSSDLKWLTIKSKIQANFNIVFAIWLLGILFFLVKMAGGMVYLQRLTRTQTLPLEAYWNNKLIEFTDCLNLKRKVQVCESYLAKVPMVVGHLKPVILLPVNLLTGLNNQEIEAILAHELAHIKRHDYLLNFLQSFIETLFFYHPAVWLMSRIIRDEREHSCDNIAVAITGDTLTYIKALALAQEFTLKNNYRAVAFAQSNSGLLTRVKRLKTMNSMKNKVTEGFFAASLIFISLVLLSFTFTGNNATEDTYDPVKESLKMSFTETDDFRGMPLEVYKDTIKKKVRKRVKKVEKVPQELETVIEVALTEENDSIATKILISIDDALKEVEWDEIHKELEEAKIEIKVAQNELEGMNIDSIMQRAMKDAQHDINIEFSDSCKNIQVIHISDSISEIESSMIAHEALEAAEMSIEAIDLDSIIKISLSKSFKGLENIDIEGIVEDALKGVKIEIKTTQDTAKSSSKVEKKELNDLEEELDELEKQSN